jgi:Raf kinase inhibitor-like YbhB/YbcL family protein
MKIECSQSWMALGLLLAAGMLPLAAQQAAPPPSGPVPQLTLMSSGFADGSEVPVKYSCDGKPAPLTPPFQWGNVPKGTVTFALVAHDLDGAPMKGMYDTTHWLLWNIPGSSTQLPEGVPAGPSMPDGTVQGKNVRGVNGFQGPCPPPGKPHHYVFELYALDTKLDVAADAPRGDVMKAMDGHVIGKASYVSSFHR